MIKTLQLITLQEYKESTFFDIDKESKSYLKENLLNEAISRASDIVDVFSGNRIEKDLNNGILNIESETYNYIKRATAIQATYLIRNGIEYTRANNMSMSSGSFNFQETRSNEQFYLVPEAETNLEKAGYLLSTKQMNEKEPLASKQNCLNGTNNYDPIYQRLKGEFDKEYIRVNDGLSSLDDSISIVSGGNQAQKSITTNTDKIVSTIFDKVKSDPSFKGTPGMDGKSIVGPQGKQGEQGATGPKGDIGNVGSMGQIGPKGDIGLKGDTGLQGLKGVKGDIGISINEMRTFVRGPKESGESLEGFDRGLDLEWTDTNGEVHGVNGFIGLYDGKDGAKGKDGIQGTPGKDGLSVDRVEVDTFDIDDTYTTNQIWLYDQYGKLISTKGRPNTFKSRRGHKGDSIESVDFVNYKPEKDISTTNIRFNRVGFVDIDDHKVDLTPYSIDIKAVNGTGIESVKQVDLTKDGLDNIATFEIAYDTHNMGAKLPDHFQIKTRDGKEIKEIKNHGESIDKGYTTTALELIFNDTTTQWVNIRVLNGKDGKNAPIINKAEWINPKSIKSKIKFTDSENNSFETNEISTTFNNSITVPITWQQNSKGFAQINIEDFFNDDSFDLFDISITGLLQSYGEYRQVYFTYLSMVHLSYAKSMFDPKTMKEMFYNGEGAQGTIRIVAPEQLIKFPGNNNPDQAKNHNWTVKVTKFGEWLQVMLDNTILYYLYKTSDLQLTITKIANK